MEPKKTPTCHIRLANENDFEDIARISDNAVHRFDCFPELSHLFTAVALTPSQYQKWLDEGRVYVAEEAGKDGKLVGVAAAFQMDDVILFGHVAVDLECQGRGIGSLVLNAVLDWARERKKGGEKARVSLMTYVEVPWNAPWYRKFGFREVDPETLGPNHVEKMRHDREERDMVRPGFNRCCMLWEE